MKHPILSRAICNSPVDALFNKSVPKKHLRPPLRLLALADRIPDPLNYLVGLTAPELVLPENIIVFRRHFNRLRRSNIPHSNLYQYVLIINLRGDGSVVLDERCLHLRPGHCLLVFPSQFHHYPAVADTRLLWLFITFKMRPDPTLGVLRNRTIPVNAAAWQWISLLIEHYVKADRISPPIAGRLVFYLWLALLELVNIATLMPAAPHTDSNKMYIRIYAIHQYLREHLSEPMTIADVAWHVHMSSSKLRTLFKSVMQVSLGHYIRLTRANYAAEKMISSDLSLSEIAEQCGFSSIYTFSRSFKETFSMSPRTYRERIRQQHGLFLSGAEPRSPAKLAAGVPRATIIGGKEYAESI